jgi:NitT/TauT family transport system substrate-binding protein
MVGINSVFLTDDLVCKAEIKTADDVKGKTIAISTFGGVSYAASLMALKVLNLSVSDVQITQVGGESTRIAALTGGSIDCAIVDKVRQAEMQAAGMNIVAKVYDPPQPFGRAGTTVTRDFFEKNPNTVLAALAAILESENMIWTDPSGTAQRFAEWLQTDVATTTPMVEDFQLVGNRSMMWTDDIFTNAKKVLAPVNPDVVDVDIQEAQDKSLLQKLLDTGFYEKIGNPATCSTWTTTKGC